MRKFATATAMTAMLVLSACEEEVPHTTYGQQETQGVIEGLTVSNARMVLAPVEGNPAAIYMDIAYSGETGVAVSGVEIEGAGSAVVHNTMPWGDGREMEEAGPVALAAGQKKSFEPGGTHIMVMEPSADLKPGGKVKGTFKIVGARTHNFEAEIKAAGEER